MGCKRSRIYCINLFIYIQIINQLRLSNVEPGRGCSFNDGGRRQFLNKDHFARPLILFLKMRGMVLRYLILPVPVPLRCWIF